MQSAHAGYLGAQLSPTGPVAPAASMLVVPAPFPRWSVALGTEAAPLVDARADGDNSAKWWGLGIGAGVGAVGMVAVAQGLCDSNESCTGPSIGFALVGALVGGIVGIFIGSTIR